MQRLLSESGCYIAGTLVPLCSPVSRSELLWNVPSPWRKLQWHFHRSCWMTFQMSECSVVTWTVWMMQLLSTNEIYTANNTSPQVFELPRYLGTWPKWPNLAFRGPFSGFQVKICFRMFSQMDVSKNHCSHLSSCEYMWIIYHWGYPVEAVGWATRYCWPSPHFHSNLTKGAVSAEKHVAMDKSSHIELSQNQDRTEQLCVCVFQIVSAQHPCSTKQRPCFELGKGRAGGTSDGTPVGSCQVTSTWRTGTSCSIGLSKPKTRGATAMPTLRSFFGATVDQVAPQWKGQQQKSDLYSSREWRLEMDIQDWS